MFSLFLIKYLLLDASVNKTYLIHPRFKALMPALTLKIYIREGYLSPVSVWSGLIKLNMIFLLVLWEN